MVYGARAVVSVRDTNKLVSRIAERSKKASQIASRLTITAIRNDIKKFVTPTLVNAMMSDPVFLAITEGNPGREDSTDLAAEFGLNRSDQNAFRRELLENLKRGESIEIVDNGKVSQTKASTRASVRIIYYNEEFTAKMKTFSSGYHPSRKEGGVLIPWLIWSLDLVDDIPDGYQIEYDLTASERARSRSGRALMVDENGSYDIPDMVKVSGSENWVSAALKRAEPQITKALEATIRKRLKIDFTKALNSRGFR